MYLKISLKKKIKKIKYVRVIFALAYFVSFNFPTDLQDVHSHFADFDKDYDRQRESYA